MSTATATGAAARLQERASRLRAQAASLHPLLGEAYRRRAAQLDVEALLEAVWNPPIDMGPAPLAHVSAGAIVRPRPLHLAAG